jgi:hypothetical protein
MVATLHVLHPQSVSLAGCLRIGHTGHRKLEALRHLDPAIRSARYSVRLKIQNENVTETLNLTKSRLMRLRDSLADLQAREGVIVRSRSPAFRGGERPISAILGR